MHFDRIYRHGDVILFRLSDEGHAKTSGERTKRLTLAFGEATGHAHQLRGDLEVLEKPGPAGRWLFRVHSPSVLSHEEHERMVLEPGVYLKVNQVEYDPFREMIVRVAD